MKNKKLFAILTLLCFMFTLMPVAAFAADEVTYSVGTVEVEGGIAAEVVASEEVNFKDLEMELYSGSTLLTTMTLVKEYTVNTISGVFRTDASKNIGSWKQTKWAPTANVVPDKVVVSVDGKKVAEGSVNVTDWSKVDGVYTIGDADAETSSFVAIDGDQTVRLNKAEKDGVEFALDLFDRFEYEIVGEQQVAIWAETANGTVTSAIEVVGAEENADNVWDYKTSKSKNTVTVKFARTGEYTVYAAPYVANKEVDDLNKFDCDFSKITVKSAAADPDTYLATVTLPDDKNDKTSETDAYVAADETFAVELNATPNNVASDKIKVNFYDADKKPLKGETVTIETNSSAIEVNKASDVTNTQGEIDFKVSASVEGEYEVILTLDGVEWTLIVNVGNTSAAYIETANQPAAPQALYDNLGKKVRFTITDINGNVVKAFDEGMDGIKANSETGKYVVLTEAPADTDLESKDLGLAWDDEKEQWKLTGVTNMDAEGTYSVKVILDNGAYATASWTVKKFQKPVALRIDYNTKTVELGATIAPAQIVYVDVNGVEKQATDSAFAATGYAIAKLEGRAITVKTDEKYVGATIDVTAVSEKYDLVATATLTVADGATAVAFVDKAADVNVNNKLVWNVVDSTGTKVALKDLTKADIKYVVLDKPEGAKVSTNDATVLADLRDKGMGKLALTCNKVGNVAVQVVVKATFPATAGEVAQVKYYTGTQIIAVGTQGVGDVVVMSIGSNEIVINDAKATIDAAPIVENNRTFVPFRALAEAFGATVAYDEATQAVTAELNGVTVVMTIGSAEYTVNGEAKTADVAPFINGSRTMVPVRFAAEAFGIKVIPTYDENGATADILFNL